MAKKKNAGVLSIDFGKEVESGGSGRIHWPEDWYHVKIVKAKTGRSENKDSPFLELTFKVLAGKKKGKEFSERFYLTPKSLVRVRLVLEAIGVKVPKSAVKIPLKKLIGKQLWVELEDEERDGYDDRSRVAFRGIESEDEHDESDDDDDDEDEDDEDEEDDDEEDEDEDDEDDEDEDDEDDEDEDDDEDEEPVKKRKKRPAKKSKKSSAKSKKSKKKSKKKSDDDDDDLEELDLDDL